MTSKSKTGVKIYDNFRENLIIDRYDPIFQNMRPKKLEHLRSENSEDAITWNTFRTLQQMDPKIWLPRLFQGTFKIPFPYKNAFVLIKLWELISPPNSLATPERVSEVDIMLETDNFVWVIEAKYKSDISLGTTYNPDRNQIIRNIDVGSNYAGKKDFYFSLLILDDNHSPKGLALINKYIKNKAAVLEVLPHRKSTDMLGNVKGIGYHTWEDVCKTLKEFASNVSYENECFAAQKCVEWLNNKGIGKK